MDNHLISFLKKNKSLYGKYGLYYMADRKAIQVDP
jgi:hypothetical protein